MRPNYVAVTSFKGGVGCSTLTVLLASRLHYQLKKKVAIIDCDPLTSFCCDLRAEEVKQKTEYPVISATADTAMEAAGRVPDDTEIVFFDIPKYGCFSLMWKMDIVYFPIEENMISEKWIKRLFTMVFDVKEKGVKTFFRAFLTKCATGSTTRLWDMVTSAGVDFQEIKIVILELKIPDKRYFSMRQYNNLVCVSTEASSDFNIIKKICIHPLESDLITISKLLTNHRNKQQL